MGTTGICFKGENLKVVTSKSRFIDTPGSNNDLGRRQVKVRERFHGYNLMSVSECDENLLVRDGNLKKRRRLDIEPKAEPYLPNRAHGA